MSTLATGKRVLEFIRDIRRTDLRWEPEVSSDLDSWQIVPAVPAGKEGFMETMQAELPDGRAFARVRVVKIL